MNPGMLVKESMEDRIKEFRSDPQKMDVTTKFVNEVVEKAKEEALKRMKDKNRGKQTEEERQKVSEEREAEKDILPEMILWKFYEKKELRTQETNMDGGNRKRGRWHSRARGFFSRLFASLCFCSTETRV